MTGAVAALEAAHKAGIEVLANGDRLKLRGAAAPPPDVLLAIRQHKPQILALLAGRPVPVPMSDTAWDTEDWAAFYDERAAITEYDGELPRHEAETMALNECVTEWLARHPAANDRGDQTKKLPERFAPSRQL